MAITHEFGQDNPQPGDTIENYYLPGRTYTVVRIVDCYDCISDDQPHSAVMVALDDLTEDHFCGRDVRKVS